MKKWIIAISVAVVIAVLILVICLTQSWEDSKSLEDIINKDIPLSEGFLYCDGGTEVVLDDEFSKIYSDTVTIKVESVDESDMKTKITIVAPCLKDILEECLPEDDGANYDDVWDAYMDDVYDAIRECPENCKVTTTVYCSVIENKGLKIIPNNDFTQAVFPDVNQLLAEVLLDTLGSKEQNK